ncbi:MAG: hypothetical protein JO223_13750 [Hyphomicrobiales bacterium]|nr:hypothetical protein [Hyphomicrobiales bacterium]MBV8440821.1 hypothetical protein [Hyphomicrobiales bacterium]
MTAAVALGGSAQATTVPIADTIFTGFGSNTGTGAFGNPWHWSKTAGPKSADSPGAGYSVWGTPGLGDGVVPYDDATPASDFEVSFTPFPGPLAINFTPSPMPGGYDEWTRFSVCNSAGKDCVAWTPTEISPSSVEFFAPMGSMLTSGDHFFVNVVFDEKNLTGKNTLFLAYFTTSVPEVSTWAMLGIGFAGIGVLGLSRRRKGSRYAF